MSELVLKLDNEQMTKLAQNIAKELNNPTKQEFIPRIEAARYLSMHVNTLDPLLRKGIIPFYKVGKKIFLKRREILELLEGNKIG